MIDKEFNRDLNMQIGKFNVPNPKSYDVQIQALQEAIERLNEAVGVKVKKVVKDDE